MQPAFKGFASDKTKNGKSGLEKAKEYIDSMEIKKHNSTKVMALRKLTEKEMTLIMTEGRIDECTEHEREQIMNFAFGEEFMNSVTKGQIKEYVKISLKGKSKS